MVHPIGKPDAQIAWLEASGNATGMGRRSETARSSNWFNGVRLRKAMSSLSRLARSMPSVPASCWRNQQHSDANYRLFDYGRGRELHETNA